MPHVTPGDMIKAAQRGEPSYVWRDGQRRRFELLVAAAGDRLKGRVLVDGSGVGMYFSRLIPVSGQVIALDIELPRVEDCKNYSPLVINGAGEFLPLPAECVDVVWSHEVLEHVQDDGAAIREMVRVLKPGGRIILFCPNRGYPYETHGIYWKGQYHFGNKLFVNYLPRVWRDKLAPHVRVYSARDLEYLFKDQPVRFVTRRVVFGAYDNIIARAPAIGKVLRSVLQALEKTPLQWFGLSHFWVIEKI